MARVLLSAYACEPGRGSEPGVGWTWATELAALGHHITVITRSANRQAVEQQRQSSLSELAFLYYDLPPWIQRWRRYPGGKALYYILWQFFAARHVRRLFPAPPFDVVHHVTYVSARFPSFMGSLGIPFWFGPVSGGETVPSTLRSGFTARERRHERLRELSNLFVPLDPLMRRTFRQAERILVTRDTLSLIPRRWQHKAAVQLAVGLSDQSPIGVRQKLRRNSRQIQLLYVGRLLEWKGVDIALRSIQILKQSIPEINLTLIGDGPARPRLAALSRNLGLEQNVHWLGWLPQHALADHYRAADTLLYPSLRDSGGMVVLEALAHGLPVVCTDLGGPGIIVNFTCGRTIAASNCTPDQLAGKIADSLLEICSIPNRLESLSYGAVVRARELRFRNLVQSLYPDARVASIA